ncbi:MAG: mechanosensitive ion channel family protein, partial [Pseudomonadota bacterium]
RGLVRYLLPPMTGEGQVAERAYMASKRCCIRVGRTLMFGLVVLVIAIMWGIDPHDLASQGVGARAAAALVEFLLVLAVGYLIWEMVTLWVNQKLAAEQTALGFDPNEEEPGGGEGGGQGGSRLATVLPLMRRLLQSAIIVITVLVALGSLNIDITPLLAGAGIIGLAIGFGAQKLVTDVVSGAFFLIDDAFRQGEYVDVEGTVGTVEKTSIRSLTLRHHRGAVHTIPYGEIPKITNYSRDWVIMKLKFTVPFDTDVNRIKKIFKKIGAEMMAVPEFAADMMQPFKSQGVLEVDDVGIVVRGKFMAKPGKQFTLRKEIYQRVKTAFDENDIQFARKEVRVSVPGLENGDLTKEDRDAIAAAAAEAAEQELTEQGNKA